MLRSALRLLVLPAGLCLGVSAPAIQFMNVSGEAGFQPAHLDGLPAGGIAVADFDGNGWPDIFVTGGTEQPSGLNVNRLYFNNGDGTFSQDAGINADLAGERCSVAAAADYDNDGWTDLYVACRWSDNHLFRNLGGKGFADVTPSELNHVGEYGSSTRTDALAWGDLTDNGHLDLFIGVFTAEQATGGPEVYNRIMLNNGDGTWTNAAENLPDAVLSRPTLAAAISDIDGDGRPDIYVVNDKLAGNTLWRNDGPGCGSWCFSDVSDPDSTGLPAYGMGIAIGDVDRDGQWDMYFSDIFKQHLLRGSDTGPFAFVDDIDSPLNFEAVGWGTIFADFDNDGWEDAFLAVGPENFSPVDLVDQLFRNNADGSFSNITAGSGIDAEIPTHSAAIIDYDRDGALDLVLHHWNQLSGYGLYRNTTAPEGNWIAFDLNGGGAVNRDAIGALVLVETPDGVQRRELRAGESRGVSHDRILHFGLGPHHSAEVTVRWPDGLEQDLGARAACRYHSLWHPQADPPTNKGDTIAHDRFESACGQQAQ